MDQENIAQHQQQLAIHRRRLEHLFQQYANIGAYTPPYIALDIEKTQAEIRAIKTLLRENGVSIEEYPDDELTIKVSPPVQPASHQLRAPVADFVGREREIDQLVQALSKASGDQTNS